MKYPHALSCTHSGFKNIYLAAIRRGFACPPIIYNDSLESKMSDLHYHWRNGTDLDE